MARPRVTTAEVVLDAAAEALAERGIGATGVDDVADAAGVSRATVYRYVGGKDELVAAVIERETRALLDELPPHIAAAASAQELVVALAATAAEAVERSPVLRRLNDEDRRDTLPFITVDGAPLVATVVETLRPLVLDHATFAVDEGSLPVALEEATRLILSHLTTPRADGGRLAPIELGRRVGRMVGPLLGPV